MKIRSVRCDYPVMAACPYYRRALEERLAESKSRMITLIISTVSLLIAGIQEQNGQAWFITMLLFVVPSFVASLFYSKENGVKIILYYIINIYTLLCSIVSILGVSGVLIMYNGTIRLIDSGVYDGRNIMSANTYFLSLGIIIGLDLIGWLTCSFYDNRIKQKTNSDCKKEVAG